MANELAPLPFDQMQQLAASIAKSGMFGIRTVDQALVLMAIAQAEGRHPALAARDYHVIGGTPSKKAEAMMRDFLTAGGRVQWHELSDSGAEATFTHPQGGEAKIRWDTARVQQAGLMGNAMHKKYPRQMLRSRVVSEGVRTVWPMATGGLNAPEEAAEIGEPIDVTTPADTAADLDAFAADEVADAMSAEGEERLRLQAAAEAEKGSENFRAFWRDIKPMHRDVLRPGLAGYQFVAQTADDVAARDADPFGLPPLPEEPESAIQTDTDAAYPGDASLLTARRQKQAESEAPAVPLAVAARALVPVAGDDGEVDWQAWGDAFVGLIRQASPNDCAKLRISSLPEFGRCRSSNGDAARAVLDALVERTKDPA